MDSVTVLYVGLFPCNIARRIHLQRWIELHLPLISPVFYIWEKDCLIGRWYQFQ